MRFHRQARKICRMINWVSKNSHKRGILLKFPATVVELISQIILRNFLQKKLSKAENMWFMMSRLRGIENIMNAWFQAAEKHFRSAIITRTIWGFTQEISHTNVGTAQGHLHRTSTWRSIKDYIQETSDSNVCCATDFSMNGLPSKHTWRLMRK